MLHSAQLSAPHVSIHRCPFKHLRQSLMTRNSLLQDRDAFVAGERAAMARSLQMLLPSQQALGMLSGGLQRLEGQVQEESSQSRQTALATAEARATAQVSCLACAPPYPFPITFLPLLSMAKLHISCHHGQKPLGILLC